MSNKVNQSQKKIQQVSSRIINRYEHEIIKIKKMHRAEMNKLAESAEKSYDAMCKSWSDSYSRLLFYVKIGAAVFGAVAALLVYFIIA